MGAVRKLWAAWSTEVFDSGIRAQAVEEDVLVWINRRLDRDTILEIIPQ